MRGAIRRGVWVAGTPVRLTLLVFIRVYRATLSGVMGGRCRFYPSCSSYAAQAIEELGSARGLALTIWRVLRCSPLSRGGVDYPPRRRAGRALYDASIQEGRPGGMRTRRGAPA